jgi:hypothetical protein
VVSVSERPLRTYAPLPTKLPGFKRLGFESKSGGTTARVGLEAIAGKSAAGFVRSTWT